MKHTIRFIILFLALVIGNCNVWAITVDDIIINIQPNNSAGTVTKSVSGMTVTLTATPASGYSIDAAHIIAEKMINPLAAAPRHAPGMASPLPVTGNGGNSFSFTIPAGYTGAFVTVHFFKATPNGITSLDQIDDMGGTYVLTADVDASGFSSLGTFTGTLDGDFHKIYNLSEPLFSSTNGAVIRNITFEEVNISKTGNVGAVTREATGASRIYNIGILSGSVGGTAYTGGLVGLLDGTARVINCYSYATITGGSDVGGIVGYNNVATTATNLKTMVMNCMFYGDIISGTYVSPVYGGKNINNLQGGLNTFNYYAYERLKTSSISDGKYNCALAVEEKYLNRFEFYRLLLNSNKKLAAFYATGSHDDANQMAKWVLETADRSIIGRNPYPYPILKSQGYYPSIINPDFENAPDSASVGRNNGGKLGKTLSVTIGGVGSNAPGTASITKGSLPLQRTDKDTLRYNFNYDKVQLPYYDEVGTGNYTGNRVVTGWKITAITTVDGDPYTAANYDYSQKYASNQSYFDYPNYNFADRKSSNKDLYSVSGRVFSQGAYFDVPYGVTSITIEPYWGKAYYIADQNYDVVYKNDYTGKQNVNQTGTQVTSKKTKFNGQYVETSITRALDSIANNMGGLGPTVYDNALVLVGNLHLDVVPLNGDRPFTMMSVDTDNDHEPDYSLIYHHKSRSNITPIRFDFLNIPGTAQAQKPNGASLICNFTIFKTRGWFEATNTSLFYTSQLEYENGDLGKDADENAITKIDAPLILLGGVIDQFVSTQSSKVDGHTIYIHVGSNVWINSFGLGTHSDGNQSTPHVPVSVTGGDFKEFYLTGTYNANSYIKDDNAECYISGGRFGEVAGAALEQIGKDNNTTEGNVHWQIYNADITRFFGGGINDAKPVKGNIITDIFNSHVDLFCGGPKFGNMTKKNPSDPGKTVTTTAEGCIFGKYFGAGYGGTSLSRKKYYDTTSTDWSDWAGKYTSDRGKYFDGNTTNAPGDSKYGKKGVGVATDFDYEFFVWSSGSTGGRFFVKFATFSTAQCNDVKSTLKKCTVETNFYGGGNLGKVVGKATSKLEDCTVKGSVYGAGYSASLPTVEVRDAGFTKNPNYNSASGMFEPGVFSKTTTFTWQNAAAAGVTLSDGNSGSDLDNHILYTNTVLTGLGEVAKTDLTITGTTTVLESVYGGGEESGVGGDTEVSVTGGTIGTTGKGGATWGNVYGGGKGKADDINAGLVKGNTKISIEGTTETTKILHNVYGGGAFGSVGTFTYADADYHTAHPEIPIGFPTACTPKTGKCNITITGGTFGSNGKDNGMVFGSSRGSEGDPEADANIDKMAWVDSTHVVIGTLNAESNNNPWIKGSVYGGGENGHNLSHGHVTVHSGTIGIVSGEKVTIGDIEYEGARYPNRGNVYGAGCGTDTYTKSEHTYFDFHAGIVMGNTQIDIDGGHVVHNVYGGGAMGSVGTFTHADEAYHEAHPEVPVGKPISCAANTGKCTINITGGLFGMTNATMTGHGNDGPDDFGHVFGAGRGYSKDPNVYPNIESCAFFNNTDLTIGGTALVCGSVYGGSESGHVMNNTSVKIAGGQIGCGEGHTAAYTDSDFASESLPTTNHWTYTEAGMGAPYDQYASSSGTYSYTGDFAYIPEADRKATSEGGRSVATDGRTFYGNVFAGGSGYYPYAPGLWLKSAGHIGGTATVTVSGGHILNNLYGGCEMADIDGAVTVTMTGGTIGVPRTSAQIKANPNSGNIYGAGMGDKRIFFNTSTNVASATVDISNGTVYGAVYGGGEDGHVMGSTSTTISQPAGKTTVIGCDGQSGYDGNVFGAGQGHIGALTAGVVGGNASLTITGGTLNGSAYGGGRIASVGTYFAMATIDDPNNPGQKIPNPLYGKMQDGDDHGCLTVSLTGGTIEQNVYGGCMGTTADVLYGESKKVLVELNKDKTATDRGCAVKGDVFGCNNVNGTPQGDVTVHVYATQNAAATQIANTGEVTDAKVKGRYDVNAVYGGGNLATYNPVTPYNGTLGSKTQVIIEGCDLTSIETVYGGGNAASTPATNVTVNGTYEIEELFGGGNGLDNLPDGRPNPGANVGYKNYTIYEKDGDNWVAKDDPKYDTKEERTAEGSDIIYGSGQASINVFGGTIHRVFGGSNTKGNVRQTAVTLLDENSSCEFCVDEAYGGGKSAPMDAEAKLLMACIPGLKAAYGGAEAAAIKGNVTLNITNGTFDRVFGGNNLSGTIEGSITVNIEEVGCRPIIIGELYGGGNQAGYSVYGYNADGTPKETGSKLYEDPQVNVMSFTSIGKVFGGGYGSGATMVGNPTVNVNEVYGRYYNDDRSVVGEDAETPNHYPIPSHAKGKMGAISEVFGGGNAAKVIGNTTVNVGTLAKVSIRSFVEKSVTTGASVEGLYTRSGEGTEESPYIYTAATGNAVAETTYYEEKDVEKDVLGVDIRGNVYGGGNNAEVTGNANVNIGKKTTTP